MQLGVIFPQTEFGSDPAAIRDYAQTAESLGFSHIVAYDHILGANPDRPGGWKGVYTYQDAFQEPFVLFSYMAGFTQKIGFVPGVIIMPQRQTALAAKQAATLDVLSGGRLRLGVGIGWNPIEYTALNENFNNRGRRLEEQVAVLRELWTNPLVTFSGQWHTIAAAGLNPMPVQQPIPLWFGGHAEAAVRRMAQLGDGWLCNHPLEKAKPELEKLDSYLQAAGRSRADFGLEARISYGEGSPATWTHLLQAWGDLGATHCSFNTMGVGLNSPAMHLAVIRKIAEAVLP